MPMQTIFVDIPKDKLCCGAETKKWESKKIWNYCLKTIIKAKWKRIKTSEDPYLVAAFAKIIT